MREYLMTKIKELRKDFGSFCGSKGKIVISKKSKIERVETFMYLRKSHSYVKYKLWIINLP
jgi:hypothetical protein